MSSIISAELFKLWKKKVIFASFIMSLFPLIYSLGIFFQWHFITITGKLNMLSFVTTMWTLLTVLGIPLIFFSYLGSSILGGEIVGGQILLQLNRVKSRGELVTAKVLSIFIFIGITYVLNVIFSILCYIFFVAHSAHGYTKILDFKSYNLSMLLINWVTVCFLMLLTILSMYFSIKFGIFRSVIFNLIIYVGLKFIVYMHSIAQWVPGYYTILDDTNFSPIIIIYQFLIILILIIAILFLAKKQFSKYQF